MKLSIRDYQKVHFSFDVLALYLNRLLVQAGFSIVGIFEVIFLYERLGRSFEAVVAVFASLFALTALLTPLGAMLIAPFGMKRLMMAAMPFAFLSILSLFLWDKAPLLMLAGFVLSSVIYKVLYWVPYHVDFAEFTDAKTRGRQMSVLLTISEVVTIVMPVIGGLIIAASGFESVFLISLAVLSLAFLPLLFIRDKTERFTYGYLETFRRLFSKEQRPVLFGYGGDGAQDAVTLAAWPIFIFLLLAGEYATVGAITSLTILAVIILRLLVGDLVDRWDRKKVLTIGSILNTTGWLIKIFIETGFQIFLVDTYHGLGRVVNRLSIDATTYAQAADNGHYIDEFTVLKEIALGLGRILMLLLMGVIVLFGGLKLAFFGAAVASLLVTLLNRRIALAQQQ